MGIRVEETDSVEPAQGQPICVPGASHRADLVMEILTCETAEPMATYTEEFYAGTPAVTRRSAEGGGEAIYIGTILDDGGYDAVIGQLIRRRGLAGPYADVDEVEFCVRETEDGRVSFVLNHSDDARLIDLHITGTDLIGGRRLTRDQTIELAPKQVLVIEEENPA